MKKKLMYPTVTGDDLLSGSDSDDRGPAAIPLLTLILTRK